MPFGFGITEKWKSKAGGQSNVAFVTRQVSTRKRGFLRANVDQGFPEGVLNNLRRPEWGPPLRSSSQEGAKQTAAETARRKPLSPRSSPKAPVLPRGFKGEG